MDDNDGNSQMGFQQHNRSKMTNCQSSGLNTNALPDSIGQGMPMMVSGSLFSSSSGLDPMDSLSLIEQLGGSSSMAVSCGEFRTTNSSYSIELEGRGLNSSAHHHLVHYPSNPNLAHLVLGGGGGGFSEMVNPFVMSGRAQTSAPLCPPNHMYGMERMAVPAQEECQSSGERAMTTSPCGKRKRDPDPPSPLNPSMNVGGDPQRDVSGETSDSKGSNEKKQRMSENTVASRGTTAKQTGKQSKDNSPTGDAAKENYIHVRARRGQATNSHSLAERVRREKISERMRLLQELVPGCSKITGKAVMLDEIINYVQSLQQQVEFLSMKLATVNPELNFDIDQILSKDILQSRGGSTPVFGFNPTMSTTHPLTLGLHQTLPSISNTVPQYHSIAHGLWDGGELQGLLPPIDFNANPASGNLGPNGSSKTDLQR